MHRIYGQWMSGYKTERSAILLTICSNNPQGILSGSPSLCYDSHFLFLRHFISCFWGNLLPVFDIKKEASSQHLAHEAANGYFPYYFSSILPYVRIRRQVQRRRYALGITILPETVQMQGARSRQTAAYLRMWGFGGKCNAADAPFPAKSVFEVAHTGK